MTYMFGVRDVLPTDRQRRSITEELKSLDTDLSLGGGALGEAPCYIHAPDAWASNDENHVLLRERASTILDKQLGSVDVLFAALSAAEGADKAARDVHAQAEESHPDGGPAYQAVYEAMALASEVLQRAEEAYAAAVALADFTDAKAEFGSVCAGERVYAQTQIAYCENHGSNGEVRYYASSIDDNGQKYLLAWETTEEWDASLKLEQLDRQLEAQHDPISQEEYNRQRASILASFGLADDFAAWNTSDESHACNWDQPSISPC